MDRRRSFRTRVLALAATGAALAGCVAYPARPYGYGGASGYSSYGYSAPAWGGRGYGYGYGGGYGYRPYTYSAPAWGGRGYGYGYGGGYGRGWGYYGG
jgi:hypothetical protein